MREQIRISGKNLGELALPGFCQRCFWIKIHTGRLPYQFFPGIFSSIDSYSKKITNLHYTLRNSLPEWFRGFAQVGRPVRVPHHSKFSVMEPDVNVMLTGAPDEILELEDGSYLIVDYKTSRFTRHQDRLFPLYEVQLNAYAYIAERVGLHPVSGLFLLYYEPRTDISADDVASHTHESGFSLSFEGRPLPVELNTALIQPLLAKVRELYDRESPPAGGRCGDCASLDELIALLRTDQE